MPEKYLITIDDEYSEGEDLAWNKVAFTSNPAVKLKGMAFSAQKKMNYAADKPKMRIAAPAIVPMTIYRNQDNEEFYVEFTPKEIEKIHGKFMKNKKNSQTSLFNLEHTEEEVPAYILEIWVVEDPERDKAFSIYGQKVPKGTLFMVTQITDESYFNSLVENEQLGYSIEGVFGLAIDKKVEAEFSDDIGVAIIDYLKSVGQKQPENWKEVTEEEFTNAKLAFSELPTDVESFNDVQNPNGGGQWLVRYKYTGPVDEKTREFCAELMDMDKIYSEEEIINGLSNSEFGNYSIFDYKGSYGCRHKWQRVLFYEDYEDNKTRKVGNVPAVASKLDDELATTFNAELSANTKTNIMDKLKMKSSAELNFGSVYSVNKWEMTVDNTSFNVGEKMTYTYDGEEMTVSTGEYELEDGSIVLVDSKGVIRYVESKGEAPTEKVAEDGQADLALSADEPKEDNKEKELEVELADENKDGEEMDPKKEEESPKKLEMALDETMKAEIEALFADKFDEIYKMIADAQEKDKVEEDATDKVEEVQMSSHEKRALAALSFAEALR